MLETYDKLAERFIKLWPCPPFVDLLGWLVEHRERTISAQQDLEQRAKQLAEELLQLPERIEQWPLKHQVQCPGGWICADLSTWSQGLSPSHGKTHRSSFPRLAQTGQGLLVCQSAAAPLLARTHGESGGGAQALVGPTGRRPRSGGDAIPVGA
jgi:hypothetical protein